MTIDRTRAITLPADVADMIETRLATGGFANEIEVIKAGLQALSDRDAALDSWLKAEVLPVYNAMKAHPERAVPLGEVRSRLHAHIDNAVGKTSR